MNKTPLKTVVDNNIQYYNKVLQIGGAANIWAHVYAKVNKINNTAEIHITGFVHGVADESTRTSTEYRIVNLTSIASVMGASNITFDPLDTRVTPIRLTSDISVVGDDWYGWGVWGLLLAANPNNTSFASICKCSSPSAMQSTNELSLDRNIFDSGNILNIDIYRAQLV